MQMFRRATCDAMHPTVRRIGTCNTNIPRVRCATFAIAATFSQTRISMKSFLHIANPTALRPYGHGPAACGLLRDECARKGFIHHG